MHASLEHAQFHLGTKGVVTLINAVEPSIIRIKIFDGQNFTLIS